MVTLANSKLALITNRFSCQSHLYWEFSLPWSWTGQSYNPPFRGILFLPSYSNQGWHGALCRDTEDREEWLILTWRGERREESVIIRGNVNIPSLILTSCQSPNQIEIKKMTNISNWKFPKNYPTISTSFLFKFVFKLFFFTTWEKRGHHGKGAKTNPNFFI